MTRGRSRSSHAAFSSGVHGHPSRPPHEPRSRRPKTVPMESSATTTDTTTRLVQKISMHRS
jgi:hypothetical protein